jgi:2,5-diketo-D-gluconate reductase B
VLREPELGQIAQRLGRPISQVALRWIVQQGVAAIPMTTKRESAISNLDVTQFSLSDADMAAIGALTKRHRRLISPSGWAPIWDR